MIRISKGFIYFNKEILSGEVGAILGAQAIGLLIKDMHLNGTTISFLVVLGAILGSAIFYLPMRIFHQKKKDNFSVSNFSKGLILYSLAAILITVIVYYPTLFFLEKYLLKFIKGVNLSILLAQTIAFFMFLLFINIYRFVLKKYFNKEI